MKPRSSFNARLFTNQVAKSNDYLLQILMLDCGLVVTGSSRRRKVELRVRIVIQWGINVIEDVIPVAPAAHYWMGGVATDLNARTSLPGLYAIGEAASTGVHGANRLASNSLLECIVFAANLVEIGLEPENLVGERPEMSIYFSMSKCP